MILETDIVMLIGAQSILAKVFGAWYLRESNQMTLSNSSLSQCRLQQRVFFATI